VPTSVPKPTRGVPQISIAHDIIAIEDAASLVTAQFHRDALRNAGADHVPDGGATEVVRDAAWAAGGDPGAAPRVVEAAGRDRMAAYSKGMRQRVLLAAALMHNPDLLVLDEPFSGLDVNAGLLFRALLGLLAAEGRMVLFSTHRFDMVEKLCSRVVILSTGHLVAEHAMADFRSGDSPSLEDTFFRVTQQADFAPVAREIMETIRGS